MTKTEARMKALKAVAHMAENLADIGHLVGDASSPLVSEELRSIAKSLRDHAKRT